MITNSLQDEVNAKGKKNECGQSSVPDPDPYHFGLPDPDPLFFSRIRLRILTFCKEEVELSDINTLKIKL